MAYNRDAQSRISRSTKQSEQQTPPLYRHPSRRQRPSLGGGDATEIVWAKSDQEIPKAVLKDDPDDCVIMAVEVEAFQLVPLETSDTEAPEAGQPGQYKFEAIQDGDEPKKYVVFNPSPTDAIAAGEWFGFLPTSAKLQAIVSPVFLSSVAIFYTPSTGIPKRVGTQCGTASCQAYYVNDDDQIVELLDDQGDPIKGDVKNIFGGAIKKSAYVTAKRNFGKTIADAEDCS